MCSAGLYYAQSSVAWNTLTGTWAEKTGRWGDFNQTNSPLELIGSKDGYTYTDKPLKVFLTQRDAHAGYNAENLSTVAGANERADYEMYTTFHNGRIMKLDDIVISDRRYGMSKIEFTVMTKKEIFGTVGKKIGWKFLLFKSPKKSGLPEIPFRQD